MNSLNMLLEVLQITAPIFVVIALGYFIRFKGIIKEDAVTVLNKLAYNIALPTLFFLSITRYRLGEIFSVGIIKVIYSTYAVFILLVFLLSFTFKVNEKTRGALVVASFRCNMAFIAFPIIISAYGGLAMAKASLIVAFLVPANIILTIIIFKLSSRGSEGSRIKKLFTGLITDPLIIAVVLAILFSYFEVGLPAPVTGVLDILSGMAVAIALRSIGASFKFMHLRNNIKLLSYISFNKLILLPVIAFIFSTYIFKVSSFDRNIICILFSTPLAVAAFIMAKEHKSDANLLSSALIMTTMVSAITISGWLLFLRLV